MQCGNKTMHLKKCWDRVPYLSFALTQMSIHMNATKRRDKCNINFWLRNQFPSIMCHFMGASCMYKYMLQHVSIPPVAEKLIALLSKHSHCIYDSVCMFM